MHPAPALVADGLATCSILSLVLVTGRYRRRHGRRKRGRKLPLTCLAHKQAVFLPFHTHSKPHLFKGDEVFQATLVSTCCNLQRHRSFIPSAHASSTEGGARGPQDLCHLAGSWHGDTNTNLLFLVLLQPGRVRCLVRPAVSAPTET